MATAYRTAPARRETGTTGIKAMLAAAAVAAVLAGWAGFAASSQPTYQQAAPPAIVSGADTPDPALRVVNAPAVQSRPAPVTMTSSSR